MKLKITLSESIWENEDARKNLEELGFRFEQRNIYEDIEDIPDKWIWFVSDESRCTEKEFNTFEEIFEFMNEWGPLDFYNYEWEDDDDWKAYLHYYGSRPYRNINNRK